MGSLGRQEGEECECECEEEGEGEMHMQACIWIAVQCSAVQSRIIWRGGPDGRAEGVLCVVVCESGWVGWCWAYRFWQRGYQVIHAQLSTRLALT